MKKENTHKDLLKKLISGKISKAEKWTLERASLDDPFLADAIEGIYDNKIDNDSLDNLWVNSDKTKTRTLNWWKPMSVAASLALLFGISFWLMQDVKETSSENVVAEDMSIVTSKSENQSASKVVYFDESEDQTDFENESLEEKEAKEPILVKENQAKVEKVQTAKKKEVLRDKKEVREIKKPTSESIRKKVANTVKRALPPPPKNSVVEEADDIVSEEEYSERTEERIFESYDTNDELANTSPTRMIKGKSASESKKSNIIKGYVYDFDGEPIKDVELVTDVFKEKTKTLNDGSFILNVNDMNQNVEVSYSGYTPQIKSLQPELDIQLEKVQSSFSEPPKYLAEMMTANELKREYSKILDEEFRNPWNWCSSSRNNLSKIELRIEISEKGDLGNLDFVTNNIDEKCSNEIQDYIRQLTFKNTFKGKQKVVFFHTIRF